MTSRISIKVCLIVAGMMMSCSQVRAVTSQIHRHSSESDLSEGKTEDVIIDSRGTLRLGHSAEVLKEDFQGIWSINSILTMGSTVYFSTSPNGGIFRYSFGEFTQLYPPGGESAGGQAPPTDANDAQDPDAVTNEHVFALAFDMSGRLLAGFSGIDCRLCRFSSGQMEVIFRPKEAKYIFDIELDKAGNIYLATGPEGKVYSLDPLGRTAQLVYTSRDKNILSLVAGVDGLLYAGSDSRGLIYKLNTRNQSADVLYDSTKPEISALCFAGGEDPAARNLYAIATSAQIVKVEQEFAGNTPQPGRPEPESSAESGDEEPDEQEQEGGISLKIANTKEEAPERRQAPPRVARRGAQPKSTSSLYAVNSSGYVTTIADKMAIFLCLARTDEGLLIGTGNDGELLRVDPVSEQQTILYGDKEASQITSLGLVDKDIFIGTANPAKLIHLKAAYASQGTYVSSLIDAKQPARWGKLQIDAEVPEGCTVLVSSRSGNVEDVNDPTFSPWTDPVAVTEPTQLMCPLGRFCQYKLILETQAGTETPVIREVAVASAIPNLAPVVEAVDVQQRPRGGKTELYEINYKTRDDNDDKLIYTIYFRKLGRTHWIQLVEDHEEDNYNWDSKTVEDGRYEIRIVASDRRSNKPDTALTGSRISDPVVIDNTGPVVKDHTLRVDSATATLTVDISDEFTAISKLDYAIDGNTDWHAAVPDDMVYDTTQESFMIRAEDLSAGEHVITIRASDDLENITYKSFDIMISAP